MLNKSNICFLTVIMALIMASLNANAVTLIAYPDGSGEYPTIQTTVNAANDGDTVLLADGVFHGRGNYDVRFLGKAIVISSLSGIAENCVIDVEGLENGIAERGFIFDNNEGPNSILQNITIIHGSADAPCPECEGGGINIIGGSPTIRNMIFRENYAATGAAISCSIHASPTFEHCTIIENTGFEAAIAALDSCNLNINDCLISDNIMELRGGGFSIQDYSTATITNSTITNNYAILGAGLSAWNANYIVSNSIISFNGGGASISDNEDSDFQFRYSDIFGNTEGDWIDSIAGQLGNDGNINSNPLYIDTTICCYYLQSGSPCINTGDPDSPLDPDGSRADMGTFYYGETGISSGDPSLPGQISLSQNYPNPFNPATSISFSLSEPSHVSLTVYDLLGRKVQSLVNDRREPGTYQVTFDASELAGGVYFYILTSDNTKITRKALLVK